MAEKRVSMATCELCSSTEIVQALVADDSGYPFGVLALCPEHRMIPHRHDGECTLRPVPLNEPDEECTVCGVWHLFYPCESCGARAFHNEGCPDVRRALLSAGWRVSTPEPHTGCGG